MNSSVLFLIAMATIVIWIAQSRELMKPSKEQSGKTIVTLTSAGSLLTLVLTISLFQSLSF
ncbi:hypothetical protein F9U64_09575 [Gracilibacillus oryzae]|uniref:Uncharacterized protein n=1 Tax=Gracilibacillus oryzae TaxID=1672701 RepID=A0A7C8GTC7_9BACI|nr:hypothetical protein [Gracilibacillus oryzae]KAB8136750.1 hypothetical protein F9U64_09575 [Gracilibacillus oryzae]